MLGGVRRGQLRRVAIAILTVAMVVSQPAAVVSVSAAGNGELTVEVDRPDGSTATEVTEIRLYRNGNLVDSTENYPSVDLAHVFSDLATDHDYHVEVEVQDQLAAEQTVTVPSDDPFTFWTDESKQSTTLNVDSRVPVSVQAYRDDGTTPLDDATMKIKSHESTTWRTGTTDDDGDARTSKGGDEFYLYPTSADGSYTVEIHDGGEVVGSRQLDSLDSATDIALTTDVPPPTYDLSVSSTGGGDVDAEQTADIEQDETVDVEADPDSGYVFDHWDGDVPAGEADDPTISVTMTEDKELEANFIEKTEVTITVSKEGTIPGYGFSGEPIEGAEVDVDGEEKYTDGDGKVQFTLAPGKHDYTVSADGFESLSDETFDAPETGGYSLSVGLVREDAGGLTVDVVDRDGDDVAANKYRVLSDGDLLELNAEGEAVLDAGTHEITVDPTDFGSDELTEVSKTVTVEAGDGTAVEFTPFETPTYTLDVAVPPTGGSVSIDSASETASKNTLIEYDAGTDVTATAEPAPGYEFFRWKGRDENEDEKTITVTMSESRSIEPVFVPSDLGVSWQQMPPTRVDDTDSFTVTVVGRAKSNSLVCVPIGSIQACENVQSGVFDETIEISAESVNTLSPGNYSVQAELVYLGPDGGAPSVPGIGVPGIGDEASTTDTTTPALMTKSGGVATPEDFPYTDLHGDAINFTVDRTQVDENKYKIDIFVKKGSDLTKLHGALPPSSQVLVLYNNSKATIEPPVTSSVNGKSTSIFVAERIDRLLTGLSIAGAGTAKALVKELIKATAEEVAADWVTSQLTYRTPFESDSADGITYYRADFDTPEAPSGQVATISTYKLSFYIKTEEPVSKTNLTVVPDLRGTSQEITGSIGGHVPHTEYRRQIIVPIENTGTTTASIQSFSTASGRFGLDDTASSTAKITNNGEATRTLFVGYSAIGPDGTEYNNDNSTGKPVTLEPGETRTVDLSWEVQSEGPNGDPLPNGEYDLVVAVWDESDRTNLDDKLDQRVAKNQITVETDAPSGAPEIQTLYSTPSVTPPDESVTFHADATDPDGTIQSYEWDFDGDGRVEATTPTSEPEHIYAEPGEYTVELTVTDDDGNTDTATTTVTVDADETETVAFLDFQPENPEVGQSVAFDASDSTTEANAIEEYRWDFDGDGEVDRTTTDPTTSYAYADPGRRPVELTIVDDAGNSASTTWAVRVGEDEEADDPDETLLEADFESTAVGGFPDDWTKSGNSDQQIVDAPASSGDRALELSGDAGRCWEAIADRETALPDTGVTEISFSIHPTTNGRTGCHDHNAAVGLRTATGSWNAGNGYGLLDFHPDGTVSGVGADLGSYQVDAWNDVVIRYARDGGEVTLTYVINGEQRATTTRDARSFEDALSYFRVKSGEYTTQIDDLEIERARNAPGGASDEFEDGTYADRWTVTEQDDETIRVEDGVLVHRSPARYNANGDMLSKAYFEPDGTVTITVRQRQADENYWGSGFGLVFEETTIELKEHRWGPNDDLTLFTDEEVNLSDATETTDWQTYNLTIDFDTMTIESVRRGDQSYQVDADLPAIEADAFQLVLGTDRGHDTRYDYVRVRGADPVESVPPDARFEVTTKTPAPDEPVTFNASPTTDPDSPIQRYEWDFDGDGEIDRKTTEPTVTHTYEESGSYEVELIAVDTDNDRDEFDRTIQVGESAIPERPPEFDGQNFLDLTAQNASGVPVEGAEIVLYDDSYTLLDSRVTDADANVTWSTLVAGEYNVELYGPDGAFWGARSVTVDEGGTSTTIQRDAPHLSTITLDGDENGEGGFYGGRPITISPEVQNDAPGSPPVRVRIDVDTDGDGVVDENVTRGGQATTISSVGYYGYDFDPSTNGTKRVRVVTETVINGNWTVTGNSSWTESFYVEHNIVGYDPQTEQYVNMTTSLTDGSFPSSSASLPTSPPSNFVPPGTDYDKRHPSATGSYPWSAVGTLSFGYGSSYFCSAAVVEDNHVITAAHCVYDQETQSWRANQYLDLLFTPGQNHEERPIEARNVTHMQTYKGWVADNDRRYDIAVLTLNESVAPRTGTFGYENNSASSDAYRTDAHVTGYPNDGKDYVDDSGEQWDIIGDGEGTDIAETPGREFPNIEDCSRGNRCHDIATGSLFGELGAEGMSGGPIWQTDSATGTPTIISVYSGNSGVGPAADGIGIRISEKKYGDIGQMIARGNERTPTDPPEDDPDTPDSGDGDDSTASATGDPHLTTFDGVSYDFQAAGEFVLARDDALAVQARLRPVSTRQVSVVSAVATRVDGREITIDARDSDTLTVAGEAVSLAPGESTAVGDGRITREGGTYTVVYPGADGQADPDDERLTVDVRSNRVDVTLTLDDSRGDDVTGLLGSPDGNASNDVAYANGTAIATPVAFETLYGPLRDDYRVTQSTSLFDYDAGGGPSTFFDPEYPSQRVTVADLDPLERDQARQQALEAGLEPGTPEFADAVLDFGLTNDPSYIDSAEQAANETNATVDATPAADVEFDDATVANGTDTLTVDEVTYTAGAHYVVVYADASPGDDAFEPGVPVGRSAELESSTDADVVVNLSLPLGPGDDVDALRSNRTLGVRLHRADNGSVGTPVRRGGDAVESTAALTVHDERITLTNPTGEYVVGDDVTVNGTATKSVDEVVIYARNASADRYVGLDLVPRDGPRAPTAIEVTDAEQFTAEDAVLAFGSDAFATYGPVDVAAVPARVADRSDDDPVPDRTLPAGYVANVTDETTTVEVVPQRLNATVRGVGGEVATADGQVRIEGTARGNNAVTVVLVGSNGTVVSERLAVADDDGRFGGEVAIGGRGLATGPVEVFVLAENRDGTFGDGALPGVEGPTAGDDLAAYLESLDADSAAEVESALRAQTVDDDGPELRVAPFPTAESDDLLDTGSFRLMDAETTVTRVAPAGSDATGVTPVPPGTTMIVEAETNLRPADNTITVELRNGGGETVRTVELSSWSTNGTVTARIDTAGLSTGSYSLVVDDRYALSTTPVTLGAPTAPETLVVAPGDDGNYSSIRAAVENASAGATVEVRPGTYHDPVVLTKNVTLIAPAGATLANDSSASRYGVQIRGDAEPTVAGLTLTGWEWGLSAGASAGDWTLRDAVIEDGELGIGGAGTPGAWTVTDVTVRNVSYAVSTFESRGSWTIRNATIRGGSTGLLASESTGDWTLRGSTITGTETAISASNTSGAWVARENRIADNARGIEAVGAAPAGNASGNWWGEPSGPGGAFVGTGDAVVGNVTVNPYYADAALTTTATVAAPSPGPANVTVTPPSIPANATLGTTLSASVTVTNVGGRSATRNVTFRLDVDGDGVLEPTDLERQDRATVTLGSGERRTVDVEAYTAGLDPGAYRYGVFTPNDSATGVVNVTRPPRAAATVQFDDATVVNGTRTVRVDRANYTGGRYYVVVHAEASPGDGTVDLGTPLGNSTELASGAHTDVSVDLDPVAAGGDSVDALTRDRSLVAVIHRADPGGDSFAGVVRADDRPVADAAAVGVRDVSQVTVGPPDSNATFGSIAHAVDSVREGGTVVLRPGTYATQVRLDRNVTLSAPDGATISGLGVRETITTGVIVADGAAPTVEGLTIRDFDWGVSAQGSAGDWTLRNLSIRNVDIGIQAADATGSWAVHGSTVVDADTEAVQARRTTGDWTISDSRVRDGSDAGVDATRATGDWTLDSTTVRGVDGAAVEATRTEGDWRVRGATVRNATEGIDATRATGDWRVRGTDVEDSVLGAVVAVDTTGDWTVTNATLRGNYRGVNATRAAGAWSVTGSRLAANGLGLDARGAAAGSATRNWWGAADGPSGVFDGGGDAVRGNALARPFYTDADLTALSAPVRASVTFDGTTVPPGTTTVRVDRVNYTGGPYVVVLARERSPGDGEPNRSAPVGVSAPLSTGTHTDVPVDIGATLSADDGLDSLDANATLVARLYRAGPPNATHGEATNATATAAVTVEPPTTTVTAGTATAAANGTATVPIRARNVTDAVYFAATVSYDPAVANVTDIVVPGIGYDPTASIDNESGTARFQAQYTGRDAPVANLTLDVTATANASTSISVTETTVYRGDAADPTVETANGRLTVVDPRATVTNTTLDVTTVRPNGSVTVNATLSNPTAVVGPVTVPLRVDGATATTLTRTVPADGTVTARFTYTPESTGTRTLAVGDGANRSLVVAAVDIEETNATTRVGGLTAPGTPLSAPLNGTNGTTDAGVSLDRLNVSTTRETDVSLSVNVSADPDGAPALGDAAAYINVSESAPEDAFERVVFEFSVETERLSDPATAELYRYHDGSWSALETTYLGVEDGEYRFRTVSPGLSVFSVRDAPSSAADADDAVDETHDGQDTPIDATDDSSTPAPEPTDDTTPDGSTATAPAPDDEEGTTAPPSTPEPDAGDGSTATAAPAPDREATPSPEPAGFDPRGIGALALLLVAVVLGALWYRRR